jgi:hypothetical protein
LKGNPNAKSENEHPTEVLLKQNLMVCFSCFLFRVSTMNYRELATAIRRCFSGQRWRSGKRSVRNCPRVVGNARRLRRRRRLGLMNAAEVVVGKV